MKPIIKLENITVKPVKYLKGYRYLCHRGKGTSKAIAFYSSLDACKAFDANYRNMAKVRIEDEAGMRGAVWLDTKTGKPIEPHPLGEDCNRLSIEEVADLRHKSLLKRSLVKAWQVLAKA